MASASRDLFPTFEEIISDDDATQLRPSQHHLINPIPIESQSNSQAVSSPARTASNPRPARPVAHTQPYPTRGRALLRSAAPRTAPSRTPNRPERPRTPILNRPAPPRTPTGSGSEPNAESASNSNAVTPRRGATAGRRTSVVWDYFTRSATHIQCDRCERHFSVSSGTSTLRFHANSCYPLINLQESPSSTSGSPCNPPEKRGSGTRQSRMQEFCKKPQFPATEAQQRKFDDAFLQLLWRDLRPFSTLECNGFRKMVQALNPSAQVKSRRTYTRMLDIQYEQVFMKVRQSLEDVTDCAICFDYWTSVSKHSYISVTIHYITEGFTMETAVLQTIEVPGHHTAAVTAENVLQIVQDDPAWYTS